MFMKRGIGCLRGVFLAASLLIAVSVHAQSPQEILGQYVAELKNNSNDYALREKIIKHVQTMSPAPAIPEEAERHMARGAAAVKNAKDVADFRDAVNEFEKATLAAPWLAGAYYNLGIARDKAGMYADAIKSLKLYILAAPDALDGKAVKNLIYEIEYKQEKAAIESTPAAIAEKKRKEYEEWLKKIDGRRFVDHSGDNDPFDRATRVLDVKGQDLIIGIILHSGSPIQGPRGYSEIDRYRIRGLEAASKVNYLRDLPGGSVQVIYVFSEDGNKITRQTRFGNGETKSGATYIVGR
jgi:tetratricopeptide (TPR) repeat protein